MILRLKIKSNNKTKKKQIFIWIEKNKEFENDIQQLIEFFKSQIQVKTRVGFHIYYKITSDNPAIMLSLLTAIQELIPDIFFNTDESLNLEEYHEI
ncbi:MAG TPA: hypothetical protein VMV43_03435 [Candidatus Nanopelagicaceae bacterium]|nr:hypothetical protein [Candidatus Nanopelagicaceae bacterium]